MWQQPHGQSPLPWPSFFASSLESLLFGPSRAPPCLPIKNHKVRLTRKGGLIMLEDMSNGWGCSSHAARDGVGWKAHLSQGQWHGDLELMSYSVGI